MRLPIRSLRQGTAAVGPKRLGLPVRDSVVKVMLGGLEVLDDYGES
jgi:hypothetical protein